MTELQAIRRIRQRATLHRGSGVVAGIGDDCAIVRPRGSSEDLLFTTDLLIESVHFRRTHPPQAIGHKALARGLSDIAAMGGEPRFALLSLALAAWTNDRWLDQFYTGFLKLAALHKTTLAGGDLARADRVTCDVVVCGAVPRGTALRRDGARPGDRIYVAGRLGASALGLKRGRGPAWQVHLRPTPRIALGRFLRESGRVTACMDLSDGLSLDLQRLSLASGLAASVALPIPLFPGASLEQGLHGGEDYELLFTAPATSRIPARHRDVLLTHIGTMVRGKAGFVEYLGQPLAPLGYDHLKR